MSLPTNTAVVEVAKLIKQHRSVQIQEALADSGIKVNEETINFMAGWLANNVLSAQVIEDEVKSACESEMLNENGVA